MGLLSRKTSGAVRPLDLMDMLEGGLDDWFSPALGPWPAVSVPLARQVSGPTVDLEDKGDHFLIKADVPGMDKKELSVSLEEGAVVLEGKREEEKKEEDKKRGYLRSERYYGSFRRVIGLPAEVKAEGAVAAYDKGVLSLKLPKAAEAKPAAKTIPIA